MKEETTTTEAQEAVDGLMWVGYSNYPTIDDFVREARKHGVCKRIGKIPNGIEFGKTRLFLAHDEGVNGDAVIFGYATIQRIEVLGDEVPERLEGADVTLVPMSDLVGEAERGCGYRSEEGAIYLRADLRVFQKPVDYNATIDETAKRFRGFKVVEGDALAAKDAPRKAKPSTRQPKYTSLDKVNPKARWTAEEEQAAIDLVVEQDMSISEAMKVMYRETGRSELGISYKFYHGKNALRTRIDEALAEAGKELKSLKPVKAEDVEDEQPIPVVEEDEDSDEIEFVD